jgi:hypothetical protein
MDPTLTNAVRTLERAMAKDRTNDLATDLLDRARTPQADIEEIRTRAYDAEVEAVARRFPGPWSASGRRSRPPPAPRRGVFLRPYRGDALERKSNLGHARAILGTLLHFPLDHVFPSLLLS